MWIDLQHQHVVTPNNMKVTNTFFKENDTHKCTWSEHGTRSLIDYAKVTKKLEIQVRVIKILRHVDALLGNDREINN
jgi:hypothetical protein